MSNSILERAMRAAQAATRLADATVMAFDRSQKRDRNGQWTDDGGMPSTPGGGGRQRPGSGGNVPTDVRDVQEYLDGGDLPAISLPAAYGGISKESYRKHFTPQERTRVLDELRDIRKGMSSSDHEWSGVKNAIKALEELQEEGS